MRILYFPLGLGTSAFLSYEIVTRLSRKNEVLVVPSGLYERGKTGLKMVGGLSDDLSTLFPVHNIMEGIRAVKRFNPDVLVSQYHPSDMISYAARIISRLVRRPLVVRSDDVWFVPFRRFALLSKAIHRLNRDVVRNSRFFLVNSTEHGLMVEMIYQRREGVVVHPNGVDTLRFNPSIDNRELKSKLGLEDKKVVLFSGSAAWFYGLDILPKAFSHVAKEVKEARLVLVGLTGDPLTKEVLLRQVDKCGIKDKVVMLPLQPYERIHEYIALGDVCIGTLYSSPVTIGTIPTKVLQYMACGKPTIVKKHGVSRDLIIHDRTGIMFDGRYENLASWIITLLEDKGSAKRIGETARNHVEKNHEWGMLVSRLEELISRAI